MVWRHTSDGREMERPGADGIHVDGPLSSEDLKYVIEALVEELVEQSKREATS